MAYIPQADVATADLWGASAHNILLHNIQAGVPDIFTAAGDMAYATAADAATRLALGTAGYHLRAGASAPAWSNIGIVNPLRLTAQFDKTNTTLANVPDFTQAVGAGEEWFFMWLIAMNASAAGGSKWAVDVPAGSTLLVSGIGHEGGDGGTEFAANGQTDATAFYTRTNDDNFFIAFATVIAAIAGNVNLMFAQNVASGTSSLLVNCQQWAVRKS